MIYIKALETYFYLRDFNVQYIEESNKKKIYSNLKEKKKCTI